MNLPARLLLPLLFLFIFRLDSFSQTSGKLNLQLLNKIEESGSTDRNLSLFAQGDTLFIKRFAQANGGTYKYAYGDIAAVDLPASAIRAFAKEQFVLRIEDGEIEMVMLGDTMLVNNDITPIHLGMSPLLQQYTGEGVVLGVIDAGIDINHLDFKKDNGNTRIKYLWDQNSNNSSTNIPAPFTYGREWNATQIDGGTAVHNEQISTYFGHGTNVTGIAAGNANANGKFIGVAPDAELIVVSFNYSRPFLSTFVDAVDYIFKKSDAMGKPCVINASLGTYYGSHDGRDLSAKLIDNMLEQRSGRVLVAANGNAGNINFHLGYDVTSDTSFTWFRANSANKVAFQLWADTADFDNVKFSIGADDPNNGLASLGKLDFMNLKDAYNLNSNLKDTLVTFTLYQGTTFIGLIETYAKLEDGVYFWEAYISPTNTAHYWRFSTTGSGKFDIWSNPTVISNSSVMISNVPPPADYPQIVNYKYSDNQKTLVSSFTCSDKVISVGNYYNRNTYIDVDGDTVNLNEAKGNIAVNSSRGPTRDGRVKPDIAATGTTTVATGNAQHIQTLINTNQGFKVGEGGLHNRNGGTSMAAPVVAGAAALYLQKNPNANYREVKDAIILSAKTDNFTGAVPNYTWGHGKLSAFAALQMELLYGCTDSTAFNYNPDANMDDASCVAVVAGCMDTSALNFNPLANVNDVSLCEFEDTTGVFVRNQQLNFRVYPNPARGIVVAEWNEIASSEIEFTDLLGRKVLQQKLNSGRNVILVEDVQKGIYFYSIRVAGKATATGKIVIQ